MENISWVRNINNFYVNFNRTCQDHTFAARIQVGDPKVTAKGMKMENVCWVKKHKRLYMTFARTCQDHTFAARI